MAIQPTEHSPIHDLEEEDESPDLEAGTVTEDPDQMYSDKRNYKETVRAVRFFIGWHNIPEFDSPYQPLVPELNRSERFPSNCLMTTGNVKKLEMFDLTLTEEYSARISKGSGLKEDQLVKPPRSQWYDIHTKQPTSSGKTE